MADWADDHWQSADGLRLHYRDYAGGADGRPPILCIPGLTRNARDFEGVAARLAGDWRVLCLDLRGRGGSDKAPDPATYNPLVYLQDVQALLAQLGLPPVVLLAPRSAASSASSSPMRRGRRRRGSCSTTSAR